MVGSAMVNSASVSAQNLAPTLASERQANAALHERLEATSWTGGLPLRCVGPTVMSGRVVDLAVNPKDPSEFLVAYASGGLWHTTDHGTSFTPLFDYELVMTLGAVAVDWEARTIWVGTGEVNSSRSSYAGLGVYASSDWGASWQHRGLADSHHIGRVVLHPDDPQTLYVAALGPLYVEGYGQRGVYKSEDAGASWRQLIGPLDNTHGAGAVDLVMDTARPQHLFASMWDRSRRAWDFREDGPGSGVFESWDGGENWSTLCGEGSGFPEAQGRGRIGLTYNAQADRLYVLLDNQNHRPAENLSDTEGDVKGENDEPEALEADDFEHMSARAFARLDSALLDQFLIDNDFPEEATVEQVKVQVKAGELKPADFHAYLADANAEMFDTPIVGSEVYVFERSEGVGESGVWQRTHTDYLEGVCYTYCYYFGVIEVDPSNADRLIIAGVPMLESLDAGQTWSSIAQPNVHVDHHAIWINPDRPEHVIGGNDGGVNVTWNGGEDWTQCNSPAVGQFYAVAVDQADPYRIYGGLQDNGTWVGSSRYTASRHWLKSGSYPYEMLGGGDGMRVQIDTRTNETVYTGSQFGWYSRQDRQAHDWESVHPRHVLGERPLRWNWQTPILLSKHNQDVLYMGSNRFHRSLNKGEEMEVLSGDLTHGEVAGNVPYGTLTDIDESPLRFGQLAVGSDDGRVHVSMDGGYNWAEWNLPEKLDKDPIKKLWISEVMWSKHDRELLYISLNGYRHDHFDSYVLSSRDGNQWTRLGEGQLPCEPVNCLAQSEDDDGLFFVGTDGGLYASLDGGTSFALAQPDLPKVPVHDLAIQERENELVIATHGRSIWVLELGVLIDGLKEVGESRSNLSRSKLSLGEEGVLSELKWRERWGSPRFGWSEAANPSVHAPCFIPVAGAYDVIVTHDSLGILSHREVEMRQGWQELEVKAALSDGSREFLQPGEYTVRIVGRLDAKRAGEVTARWSVVED